MTEACKESSTNIWTFSTLSRIIPAMTKASIESSTKIWTSYTLKRSIHAMG